MENFKIILFICNWSAHAAYQTLQDNGYQIPPEVLMIRIPCVGRITKALLLKSFEMGADGVALIGCSPGACRYGRGSEAAQSNTEDTEKIIDMLGLGSQRVRHAFFLPDESESLKMFLDEFCREIKNLGKSPIGIVRPSTQQDPAPPLRQVISQYDVHACQDCGKCTSSCPLALSGKEYSPRAIVNSIVKESHVSLKVKKDINACLTCGVCYERCPSAVNFPEFIRDMRHYFDLPNDKEMLYPHGGFFHSLMRTMTTPDLKLNRWAWLPKDIRINPESRILFFGGCAPYFDAFFKKRNPVNTSEILSDSIRLLNFFDVHPRVMDAERCCGHDLLWSGDQKNFLRLAELNVNLISNLGVEEVITACPECYRTLRFDYETYGVKPDFKVTHLYEFLETQIDKGAVAFDIQDKRFTYQDSCRLNRIEGLREYPRKLINRLSGGHFIEMKESDRSAICCGNCAWIGCDSYSKALQVKRLRQAHETGAEWMITSCPKCQIHLRCAMEDPFLGPDLKMELFDLTKIIARTIRWE